MTTYIDIIVKQTSDRPKKKKHQLMHIFSKVLFTAADNSLTNKKLNNAMEQHTFKNVNNCLNINIYSYLETSGGQSSNLYLNVVHFFYTRVN